MIAFIIVGAAAWILFQAILLLMVANMSSRLRQIHPQMVILGATYQKRYAEAMSAIATAEGLLEQKQYNMAKSLLREEMDKVG